MSTPASGGRPVGGSNASPTGSGGSAASGDGRPSFSKALQAAHHDKVAGTHSSSTRADATAGIALPPAGNPLPGLPPWAVLGSPLPPSAAPTGRSSARVGDPRIAAIDGIGNPGGAAVERSFPTLGIASAGPIEPPPAARTEHTAPAVPTGQSLVPGPQAMHDVASATTASAPAVDARAALAPPSAAAAGAAQIAARSEIAAALRASDVAASPGGEADRLPTTGRVAAAARASGTGSGATAGSSALVGATTAATAGGPAPNGALAKIAAAPHATSVAAAAHADGKTPTADPSAAIADPSQLAASALAPAPPPATGLTDHAALPAHGPIDLGSHELPAALAGRVTWLADQSLNGASLQVNPPHLGPVELRISVERGHAAVWLGAHNAVAFDALQSGAPRLRELLGAHGFTQVSVDVSRQSYGDPGAARQPFVPPAVERATATTAVAVSSAPLRAAQGMLDAYA
ncbi:MAG: flagellar hook-length control protein FliK [Gammaproteobacteria bacterium]|nr:flagellar hook-length control protein FliK [Gammaproteobacteria bacterium]